jgi:hypothetical protein
LGQRFRWQSSLTRAVSLKSATFLWAAGARQIAVGSAGCSVIPMVLSIFGSALLLGAAAGNGWRHDGCHLSRRTGRTGRLFKGRPRSTPGKTAPLFTLTVR